MNKMVTKRQAINQQTGFTLIELVTVIVLLGILAAVAAPKFIDLTGDAKAAKLKAANGAIKSAAAMVYAKSVIHGVDNIHTLYVGNSLNPHDVSIHWGYPNIQDAGIATAAGLSLDDYERIKTVDSAIVFQIKGSDVFDPHCHVQYGPDSGTWQSPPLITIDVSGC